MLEFRAIRDSARVAANARRGAKAGPGGSHGSVVPGSHRKQKCDDRARRRSTVLSFRASSSLGSGWPCTVAKSGVWMGLQLFEAVETQRAVSGELGI